jgi:CDP-diacylglycerol--glycerol-3-phosphate 3-phosphatidyltransferase
MNLPNSITMSRIVMIPLLLWILSTHFPLQGNGEQEVLASILFIMASITDGLDGYLARSRGQITTMGMLLDQIADKIMVTGALIALVAYNPQVVKVWIAVVIIGREFLISGLRSIASSEGFTIQASDLGKLKTVAQIVSVVAAILAHHWDHWQVGVLIIPVKWYAVAANRSRIEGSPQSFSAGEPQECKHSLALPSKQQPTLESCLRLTALNTNRLAHVKLDVYLWR